MLIIAFICLATTSCFAASFGSGFIISKSGHVITCEHCVPKGSRVTVLTQDGLSHEASVLFRNAELDLACLKIDGKTNDFLPVGDSAVSRILDPIYVFGFPLPSAIGSELSASKGTLNAIRMKEGLQLLQIDAPVNPGNSGGPVLNNNGAVIGIAVSKLDPLKAIDRLGTIPERINFAVPSSVLRKELQRHDIAFEAPKVQEDFEELRTVASAATVQIIAATPVEKRGTVSPIKTKTHQALLDQTARAAANYVLLGNNPDLESELSIYAPKVDFYSQGTKDLTFIRKDLVALRKSGRNATTSSLQSIK